MKKRQLAFIFMIISVIFLFQETCAASTNHDIPVVLFDSSHSQDSGNSDWTIDGAYSDLADLLRQTGFEVRSTRGGLWENLDNIDILVIPEPNSPLGVTEIKNILDFTRNGGSLFLIGNHKGADRNGNGFDSVSVFNEFKI